jgi:transcriptional regulator GlxA family with amidase domain
MAEIVGSSSLPPSPIRRMIGVVGTREVVVVVYPGIQPLDVVGPIEVLSMANQLVGSEEYRIRVAAVDDQPVSSPSGLTLGVHERLDEVRRDLDTLLVAGGEGTREAFADDTLLRAIRRLSRRSRRVASVCSGAFLLAAAGLLDGKRATTHWGYCDLLASTFPAVTVEPEPIFVRDGKVTTSAGVTAGMDLTLALVEEDLGRDVALAVARRLVLFLRRPGGQSQFSAQLSAQVADRDPLRDLQAYIAEHHGDDLTVAALARRAGLSERHLARVFREEIGVTPARYVERTRLESARRRLEETDEPIEAIATACGFGTAETMRRTFLRSVRTSPSEYRRRFQAA